MRTGAVSAAVAALALSVMSAQAQEGTGCAAFKWHIDREQTAFAGEGVPTVSAGAQLHGIMEAASLKLAKQEGMTFDVAPTHKPKNNPAFAGVFQTPPILVAGPYLVTISNDGWIDVVQGGRLLRQTAFSGAKGCHDVRKSVRFDLAQGPATVMITDAPQDTLKIDLLPPPP